MGKIQLKDGSFTTDPRLDRLVHFDERSRAFGIRECLKGLKPRSYTWRCTTTLDQGNEGSCVGHGLAHELLARPAEADPAKVTHEYARNVIYFGAQKNDDWPGGAYPGAKPFYEGTSVLAGLKMVTALGWCKEYRWSFSLEDLILGVGHNGPAVMGTSWLAGMENPDGKGWIYAVGGSMGGHCYLVRGVSIKEEYFLIHNSWGSGWGSNGDAKISFGGMMVLLADAGEAAFLIGRKTKN